METISTFLTMGGYASYIWPAFSVVLVVLVGLLVSSLRSLRSNEAALKALQSAGGERRRGRGSEVRDEA